MCAFFSKAFPLTTLTFTTVLEKVVCASSSRDATRFGGSSSTTRSSALNNHRRRRRKSTTPQRCPVDALPIRFESQNHQQHHRRNEILCRWRRRDDDDDDDAMALERATTTTTTTTTTTNASGKDDERTKRTTRSDGRRRDVLATTIQAAIIIIAGGLMHPKPDDARAFPNLKDSQSTFQLGALRTSAQRLHTLREDIIEAGTVKPGTKEAIERLQNATLDCASARAALEAYSNVRDVCTLSIVLKSVSKRFATEDEKATATRRKEAAVMAYAELERLLKDENASTAHLDEGFDAARDALRQFAESVVDAFAFDESAAKAKREEFPELFAS